MNFRGYAGYVSYIEKMENKYQSSDDNLEDDNKGLYSNSNNSEENENQGSNYFEILEKLNLQARYCFSFNELSAGSKNQIFYHLELYSLLKPSLSTPPPEFI